MEFFGDTLLEAFEAAMADRKKPTSFMKPGKPSSPKQSRVVQLEVEDACREWMRLVVRPAHCRVVALSTRIGDTAAILNRIDARIENLEREVRREWTALFSNQSPPSIPNTRRGPRRAILESMADAVQRLVEAFPNLSRIRNLNREIGQLKLSSHAAEAHLALVQRLKDRATADFNVLRNSRRYRECQRFESWGFPNATTCAADAARFSYVPPLPNEISSSLLR